MDKRKPQTDFDYMQSLMNDFFRGANFKDALRIIAERDITGWEVWFQVEFARFLAGHESEPEWQREYPLEYDYRKEKMRYFFKPDFIIRKKHWILGRYMALEIKQHKQPGNCLTNMVSDLAKVSRIRVSELDIRSIWALGIFPTDQDIDLPALIKGKLEGSGRTYYPDRTLSGAIPRTPFSYVLF